MSQENLFKAAECLATYAEFMSYQTQNVSPYTQGAIDHGKPRDKNLGGKPDDITVIVA